MEIGAQRRLQRRARPEGVALNLPCMPPRPCIYERWPKLPSSTPQRMGVDEALGDLADTLRLMDPDRSPAVLVEMDDVVVGSGLEAVRQTVDLADGVAVVIDARFVWSVCAKRVRRNSKGLSKAYTAGRKSSTCPRAPANPWDTSGRSTP